MLSAFTLSSHCLLSTLATESRIKPVVSESPHRNINAAESMAVWKSGTSPVAKSSIMMGMPIARPITAKMSATSEKNFIGRSRYAKGTSLMRQR